MRSKIEIYEMIVEQAKNHCSYSILDNGISSFCPSYDDDSDNHYPHYLSESSHSLTDPNFLQNKGSHLDTHI